MGGWPVNHKESPVIPRVMVVMLSLCSSDHMTNKHHNPACLMLLVFLSAVSAPGEGGVIQRSNPSLLPRCSLQRLAPTQCTITYTQYLALFVLSTNSSDKCTYCNALWIKASAKCKCTDNVKHFSVYGVVLGRWENIIQIGNNHLTYQQY